VKSVLEKVKTTKTQITYYL